MFELKILQTVRQIRILPIIVLALHTIVLGENIFYWFQAIPYVSLHEWEATRHSRSLANWSQLIAQTTAFKHKQFTCACTRSDGYKIDPTLHRVYFQQIQSNRDFLTLLQSAITITQCSINTSATTTIYTSAAATSATIGMTTTITPATAITTTTPHCMY